MFKRFAIAVSLFAFCAAAFARGAIDLTTLDHDMTGQRAQVMVLGTVHLGEMKEFDAAALSPVIDKLAAFKPQIITIEAIPGEMCDLMARNPTVYGPDNCANADAAKAASGLDIPSAIAEVNKTLKAWPAQPTATQRRHLAALFLAANDRASADTQWLQLPQSERHSGDGLADALVALLQKIETTNNESYQIAARLAAKLGLQRVFPVDDHTGDNVSVPAEEEKAFEEAVQAAWDTEKPQLTAALEQQEKLAKSSDLLPLYRYINRPDNLAMLAKLNVEPAMRAKSPQRYPQFWVAGWETRNLRMIANIRATFRERPGARVLSIVGSSHKPWFDGWLGQMQGVDIVDAEKVLK